jgi:hypothetical protein
MADLTPQTTVVTGTVLTPIAPTVTVGDWVPIGSYVTVRNGSGSSINVTIVVPGNDAYGSARPDPVKAVAAGANTRFGPFPYDLGDPAHSNMINIICSAVATVTLEVTN